MKEHIIFSKLKKFSVLGPQNVTEEVTRGETAKEIRGYIKKDLESLLKYFELITRSLERHPNCFIRPLNIIKFIL